ncbi:26S proteasome regulatory subunit rpn12 [Nosema granulosis]|uniref:26S proteasome regulatory subunit rpn12 n=1 Tax=Nosema granulosis TaxID=83296 RepID=A0A9P6GZB7_9MICR|nr:26S proteasome regulatory subunit rpn12 [Nosema granulosis]
MYEGEIKKLEETCINNIKNNNPKDFELNYNMFTTFNVSSPHLKAYMLMLLLSQNRVKDYYKHMQSVKLQDMDNELIKMVMYVERITITGNLRKLENLTKTCKYPEFVPFLKEIYFTNKNSINEDVGCMKDPVGFKSTKKNEQTVKDSLFIGLNAYIL